MKWFSKIMVGCNFSSYSKKTLEYEAHLAEKLQAELIIVNVINKRDIDTILKVAEEPCDRTVEKYVHKCAIGFDIFRIVAECQISGYTRNFTKFRTHKSEINKPILIPYFRLE